MCYKLHRNKFIFTIEVQCAFSSCCYLSYYEIAREVVQKAIRLKNAFVDKGYAVEVDFPTNQQFFRLPNDVIDSLKKNVSFEMWGPRGETESVVRFVTGWTTTEAEIDELISYLDE